MSVDLVKKELKKEFPAIDKELRTYVEGTYYNGVGVFLHPVFFDNHEIFSDFLYINCVIRHPRKWC